MYPLKNVFFGLSLLSFFVLSCANNDTVAPATCEQSTFKLLLDKATMASDCSARDGAIAVSVQGGEAPYSFLLNGSPINTNNITGLAPGIYSVLALDKNGCQASLENVNITAENFSFQTSVTDDTQCSGGNGEITIAMDGGNQPYTFKLNDNAFTTDNTFSDLEAGVHVIQAKDAGGCTVTLNITVAKGPSNTSWVDDIEPIMGAYCATSGCHNGESRVEDFRVYETAKRHAANIKKFTRNKIMPQEGSLTQTQIDLISCWVDEGAKNN